MKRAPGHLLVQAGESGLAEHRVAAAGIRHAAEQREALLPMPPGSPALAQEAEVLREQSEDHSLTVGVPARMEVGTRKAVPLEGVRQLALNRVNQPLHPANAAEELNVGTRLRDGLEARELNQGRLLFGWIEAGAHDLQLRPGRVRAAPRLQITNSRAERSAGRLLEIVEAFGFAQGLVPAGLRAEGVS